MPTYEYKCLDCGRRFEVFQKMTDEPLAVCEVCKGKVKRMIGAGAGIIFKGSGFYCTDYRSKTYQNGAKNDKPAAKESDKASAGASETKSKPSSESKKS